MKSSADEYRAVHPEPVWRARANFLVAADIGGNQSHREREQLWVKQVSDFRFELCCIPFFVYDLALGDEVETDQHYIIRKLVRPSGHHTFRVWFGESKNPSTQEEVVDMAKGLGCEWEWSSTNLLAIDAATASLAQELADYLYARQTAGDLTYETGRTS
jgi:hypothetical protein